MGKSKKKKEKERDRDDGERRERGRPRKKEVLADYSKKGKKGEFFFFPPEATRTPTRTLKTSCIFQDLNKPLPTEATEG